MKLEKKIAVVTASTRGIGYACAKRLAQEGARVYMGVRDMARGKEAAEKLREKGLDLNVVYQDAVKKDTYKSMIEEVTGREGGLDILVNNFGTSNPKTDTNISGMSYEEFMRIVDLNLASVFLSTQAALPHMKKSGGSIINISSVGGVHPDISQFAYGTSKAAINYLTKLIAVEGAADNIRCNGVLPGLTATDAVKDNLSDAFRDFFLKHTPIKRMGRPEEIAAAVCYFASDDASYVTGQILEVSGGFGMPTPLYGDMIALKDKR